jgi:AcrR family transcriptional regulator
MDPPPNPPAKARGKRGPGRPPSRPALDGPNPKDAILAEAIKLLAERGKANFTLRELSLRLRVTPAAIHYHFRGKHTLVEGALDRFLLPLVSSFWQAVRHIEDPVEAILALQERLIGAARQNPWFLPMWMRDIASMEGRLRGYLRDRLAGEGLGEVVAKIRRGQGEGRLNPSILPEMAFISVVAGTLLPLLAKEAWEWVWGLDLSWEDLERHVRATTMGGILAGARAPGADPKEAGAGQGKPRAGPGAPGAGQGEPGAGPPAKQDVGGGTP